MSRKLIDVPLDGMSREEALRHLHNATTSYNACLAFNKFRWADVHRKNMEVLADMLYPASPELDAMSNNELLDLLMEGEGGQS